MNTQVDISNGTHAELGPGARLRDAVNLIAGDIASRLGPGEVAALRRMRPLDVDAAPFWRIVASRLEPLNLLPGEAAARTEAERRWAVILSAMARLAGLHVPGARLGRVLAELDFSELRFLRLIRSHDVGLADIVRVTAHTLASRAKDVDCADLAQLVLSDGRGDEDRVRRNLARDYYQLEK